MKIVYGTLPQILCFNTVTYKIPHEASLGFLKYKCYDMQT